MPTTLPPKTEAAEVVSGPKRAAALLGRLWAAKRGAAMVEYALLAALIAVVASAALTPLGTNIKTKFTAIAGSV